MPPDAQPRAAGGSIASGAPIQVGDGGAEHVIPAAFGPGLGSLGCVSIAGDVGWLIRIAQFLNKVNWKPWTWRKLWKLARSEHVVIYVGNGDIVEAEPGGARLAPLSEYDGHPIIWLQCPPEHGEAVAAAAMALIETPYGWADYLAFAARRLHLPLFKRVALSTGSMVCSTLGVVAARRGGWGLMLPTPAGYIDPEDIAAFAGGAA